MGKRWLKTEADWEEERIEKERKVRMVEILEERRKQKDERSKRVKKEEKQKEEQESEMEAIRRQEDPENNIHQLTTEKLQNRVKEIIQMRGRKQTDTKANRQKLEFYVDVARKHNHGPGLE